MSTLTRSGCSCYTHNYEQIVNPQIKVKHYESKEITSEINSSNIFL